MPQLQFINLNRPGQPPLVGERFEVNLIGGLPNTGYISQHSFNGVQDGYYATHPTNDQGFLRAFAGIFAQKDIGIHNWDIVTGDWQPVGTVAATVAANAAIPSSTQQTSTQALEQSTSTDTTNLTSDLSTLIQDNPFLVIGAVVALGVIAMMASKGR